jgi:uncharacterized protein (TIGR02996 family)
VTTEDDFQKQLDAKPDDWQTRLVFADWLDERGDVRAEGYRALAACRFVLCDRYPGEPPRFIPHQMSRIFCEGNGASGRDYTLPADWYEQVLGLGQHAATDTLIPFDNRRAAEDAAALAFASLPARRRAALLKGRVEAPKRKPAGKKGNAPAGKAGKKPPTGGSGRGGSTPPRRKKAVKRSSGRGRSRG